MKERDGQFAMLQSALESDAVRLRAAYDSPIDLSALLDDVGVMLVVEPSEAGRVAHGLLRQSGSDWQIVISDQLAPTRRRYSIAHELGHYLIEARIGYRPMTSSEYWRLEDLCQAFAGSLLVPPTMVAEVMTPTPTSSSALLDAAVVLARRSELSLEASIRRIVETSQVAVAFAAISLADPPRLLWSHSTRPWFSSGRGSKLRAPHPLAQTAVSARSIAVGGEMGAPLRGAVDACVQRRAQGFALVAAFLDPAAEPVSIRTTSP